MKLERRLIKPVIDFIETSPNITHKRGRNPGGTHPTKDIICAFDIETTRIPGNDNSIMYIWQLCVDKYAIITGRDWEQCLDVLSAISQACGDSDLIIYDHLLSFEFQYLSGVYKFKPEDVFAVKSRKVLKCKMFGNLIFRCSYLLTNVGLREFLREMRVPTQKGEMDYDKPRFAWTELTMSEYCYAVDDVIGLVEAMYVKRNQTGDTWLTIPLTQTGYVRRDARRALQPKQADIKLLLPDCDLYRLLKDAFRGGNTHANRWYTGEVLEKVGSFDIVSSYPTQQVERLFPMTPFKPVPVDEAIYRRQAWVARARFINIYLKNEYWGFPYIPVHKCYVYRNCEKDNGRVLAASYIEIAVTDIDFDIISNEYHFDDVYFYDSYASNYQRLPRPLRHLSIELFRKKTEFKGVSGMEVEYSLAKQKINSIYGMSAQDPAKLNLAFIDEQSDYNGGWVESGEISEILEKSRAFMPYQWGVWTTAHARMQLEDGLLLAGNNGVYCDTDSVKYIGKLDLKQDTAERVQKAKDCGAYARDKNKKYHYMGVFEREKTADKFITWGAKRYAYEQSGKLHITIAGVNKILGAEELQRKGGIYALKPGFTFTDAGGAQAIYNDTADEFVIIDGRKVHITRNVTIEERTYHLGLSPDYNELLLQLAIYLQKDENSLDNFEIKC